MNDPRNMHLKNRQTTVLTKETSQSLTLYSFKKKINKHPLGNISMKRTFKKVLLMATIAVNALFWSLNLYAENTTVPSVGEIYRIVQEQKQIIEKQNMRIQALEQQLRSPKEQPLSKVTEIATDATHIKKKDKTGNPASKKKPAIKSIANRIPEEFSMDIHGKYWAAMTATDQGGTVGSGGSGDYNSSAVRQDAEIYFEPKLKINSNLTIGAHVELEASTTGDQIDEHYLFAETKYGKLILGSDDSAAWAMKLWLPTPTDHFVVDDPFFFNYQQPSGNSIGYANTSPDSQGDSNKVSFISSEMPGGFRLGYSYAPSVSDTGGSNDAYGLSTASDEDGYNNGHSLGVQWKGVASDWKLQLAGGINTSELEADADGSNTDRQEWVISSRITRGPVSIGALFKQDNQGKAGPFDRTDTSVGTMYKRDDWKVGLNWASVTAEVGTGLDEDHFEQISLSGARELYRYEPLSASMGVFGGIDRAEWDGYAANRRSSGNSLFLGSYLKW